MRVFETVERAERRFPLPLLFLALAMAFFWRLLPEPNGFLYPPRSSYSDLTITHWPNALFIRRSLAKWGQIPLWRPLILGGEPFAANPLSGLWYPPNLLLLALPLPLAFNALFVLHTAWAGWGGYRLARGTGATRAGSLLTALTLMLAPKAIAHLGAGHVGLYYAWCWIPWAAWAARRLSKRVDAGAIATAAVALAMMVLADPRIGFYGSVAAAGYWLWSVLADGERVRGKVLTGAGMALLAGALVAVQVVPLATMAGRLNRGGLSAEEGGTVSLPPRYLLGMLVPDRGGFHEWMTYLGAVGLSLAAVGMIRWRDRERWWWGGLALAAAIYSLGTHTPLYGALHRLLAPLRWLRGPARGWFLVTLAVGVLAAQGLTSLQKGRWHRRRRMDLVAIGLLGAALSGGAGSVILRLPTNVVVAAVVWPLSGALIALRLSRRLRPALFAGLALALALLDLGGMGLSLYRVRSAEDVLAEGREAAAWLSERGTAYAAERSSFFRVYSPSYSIPQHTGALYGIEAADGIDPFQLADYGAFMQAASGLDLTGYSVTIPPFPETEPGEDMLLAHRDVIPDLELLGLLNVKYLAAAYPMRVRGLTSLGKHGDAYLHRNERVLPRAFVVGRAEARDGLEGALRWLSENEPGQAAVVDGGPSPSLEGPPGRREAIILQWSPNLIRVEAQGPGLLVLSEVYDPDWQARVDGSPAELIRTDGILRGVHLEEEGRHRVTFRYRPAGLRPGLGVTAVGWICAAVLWIVGWKRGRSIDTKGVNREV